ncbi:MAG: dihydroneopterin aldolase, partial [Nanoarchaeota archaeon]
MDKFPLVTAGALIFNRKNQIIFVKSDKWKGQYGIPAGKVRYGEKVVDGLKREIKEETNLEVYDVKFLLAQEIIEPQNFFKKAHFVSINHLCRAKNDNVKLNDEAESYKWINPEDVLIHNFNKPTKELVQYYLKTINKDKIIIKGLEVECIVGIRKKERKAKQKIYVTVEIFTNTKKAAKSSNIKDAINYSSMIKNIKKLIINKKYLLLETMAEDIVKMILRNKNANEARILIKKPKAIRNGKFVGVEIQRC